MREETTNLTHGIQKPKLSNMDTVALAVNQLPLGQDQQNLKIIGGHVINMKTILPDMIMEEIMNSRDQDHLMQVKIVNTKILDNLMIKEATVKKGKKNRYFISSILYENACPFSHFLTVQGCCKI